MSKKDYVFMMHQCGEINQWQIRKVPYDQISNDPNIGKIVCTCYDHNVALNLFAAISKMPDVFVR